MLTSGQQQNIDKLVMKIKSTGHKVESHDDLNVILDAGSTEKFVAGLHLMREVSFFTCPLVLVHGANYTFFIYSFFFLSFFDFLFILGNISISRRRNAIKIKGIC